VIATFDNGTRRDVTDLALIELTDPAVAELASGARVAGKIRGETAVVVRYGGRLESTRLAFVEAAGGAEVAWRAPAPAGYIDELVHERLRRLRQVPSPLCSDAEFVRRVYLDLIGLPPTPEEVREFLGDSSAHKRARLVDALLERPEYARFWARKWGDLLRLTSSRVGDGGVHKLHLWLERAFASNLPYDVFATELLTASGSSLTHPPAAYYKIAGDAEDALESTAQLFLGVRLQCAKCHDHPFERWTQDDYYGMASFFSQVQRRRTGRPQELLVWSDGDALAPNPRHGEGAPPWLPHEGEVELPPRADRREALVGWLRRADNPFFAHAEVNRLWYHLMGRGIVEPVDDFRITNPPSNPELLEALARNFVAHGYDRRYLLRTIANSHTYQTSSRPTAGNAGDQRLFSHYRARMLTAEQLFDAMEQAIGVRTSFAGTPPGTRATQLPAPDLIGEDAGLGFLRVFGLPERQTVCACDRPSPGDTSLTQALELLNGGVIHAKLAAPAARWRRDPERTPATVVEELYLATFCRPPRAEELETSLQFLETRNSDGAGRDKGFEDLAWALLASDEFLFQH
jgi:hypothetical protein